MLRGGVLYIMLIREILNRANRGVKVGSSRHMGFFFPPIVMPQGLSVLLQVLLQDTFTQDALAQDTIDQCTVASNMTCLYVRSGDVLGTNRRNLKQSKSMGSR